MSTSKVTKEKNNDEEYTEDNSEGTNSHSWMLLKTENEKYRQEIHDLKRKLLLNEAMLREVQESNELLECVLDQRISDKDKTILEIEEKYRIITKEYENIISNLETKVAKQTTEIEKLSQYVVDQRVETECATAANHYLNAASFEADNVSLKNRIDELLSILQEERNKYEQAEETIEELKNRCNEFERYSQNIKQQLDEERRTLEDVRAELNQRLAETVSLEIDPTLDACKGNSLFAEVEDRRQNAVDKVNMLREKYTEIKRVCKSQVAEIKMLRTERIAALRKWKNDTDHTLAEQDELIQKYKNRISDLESKLKSEIRKNDDKKQVNCGDASFGYFQSLLDAKRKEIDQLRIKVENLSTKILVQEEAKMNITKQLQYWRYKASSLEAELCTVQTELKLDLADDAECKILNEFENHIRDSDVTNDETEFTLKQQPKNSILSLLQNSAKSGNICPVKDSKDCKIVNQSRDKDKTSYNNSVRFEMDTQSRKSDKFEHTKNTEDEKGQNNYFIKTPRFKTTSNAEEDKGYPTLYIPINSSFSD